MIYGERPHLSINPELWRPFFILRDRGFRKCGEKLSPADQTDFFSNKTAGHKGAKEQCARRFGVFPRTSEIRVRERCRQGELRNIYPVKTGGSRYGCHPFFSYQPKAGMLLLNAAPRRSATDATASSLTESQAGEGLRADDVGRTVID